MLAGWFLFVLWRVPATSYVGNEKSVVLCTVNTKREGFPLLAVVFGVLSWRFLGCCRYLQLICTWYKLTAYPSRRSRVRVYRVQLQLHPVEVAEISTHTDNTEHFCVNHVAAYSK